MLKKNIPILYKYIPSKFTVNFLNKGEVLFRNLTYFRQHEDKVRGDVYEGIHRDCPEKGVTIENITQLSKVSGKYSFLNSTNSDLIFAFCLSQCLTEDLMKEFKCDTCIEIFNPNEFIRRIRLSVVGLVSTHKKVGLIAKPVHYYHPSEPALFDIENPRELAFAKNINYEKQEEFRLVFGKRKAFRLERKLAHPNYDPYEDALTGQCLEKTIKVGNLNDVARIISL